MKVILKTDVPTLGRMGELVTVKDGYARNFLVPKGKAVRATVENVKQLEHDKGQIERLALKLRQDAEALAIRLKDAAVTVERAAGDNGKLFGSVTSKDIEDALRGLGFAVEKRQIALGEPLKSLGESIVDVKLAHDVVAQVKVNVVAKA